MFSFPPWTRQDIGSFAETLYPIIVGGSVYISHLLAELCEIRAIFRRINHIVERELPTGEKRPRLVGGDGRPGARQGAHLRPQGGSAPLSHSYAAGPQQEEGRLPKRRGPPKVEHLSNSSHDFDYRVTKVLGAHILLT